MLIGFTVTERAPFWGLVLIAGSMLVGVAGLCHPVLSGDGAAQLATIAATAGWRTIHWSFAFGYVLSVAGLVGAFGSAVDTGATTARVGASLAIFGYALSLVGVLLMLGSAGELAGAYRERSTDEIILLYDVLHPFALAGLRIGAFAVSLAIGAFGCAIRIGRMLRGWLGWLGLGAGLAGAAAALFLPETSPFLVAGVGLAAIWQLLVGMSLVAGSRTTEHQRFSRTRSSRDTLE